MANKDHVGWLAEGRVSWNERRRLVSFVPDLSGVDFTEVLSGRGTRNPYPYFSRFDFSDADLSNANFGGMDFSRAKFRNANLRNADLTGARLEFADFRGAVMFAVRAEKVRFLRSEDAGR